jgi:hypothetical protein
MIARFIVIAALLLFAVTTAPLASLTAQTPSAAAHKQDQARAKFQELTERMAKLMPELQKTEPESSSLLKAGLTFAQEKKLQQRLDQAGVLLQGERWDEALVAMGTLKADLATLLDLLQARDEGKFDFAQIKGDLFELCRGKAKGRSSAEEITLFKSAGTAIEDLATAIMLYQKAR